MLLGSGYDPETFLLLPSSVPLSLLPPDILASPLLISEVGPLGRGQAFLFRHGDFSPGSLDLSSRYCLDGATPSEGGTARDPGRHRGEPPSDRCGIAGDHPEDGRDVLGIRSQVGKQST